MSNERTFFMKKQNFIEGSLILIASAAVSKVIGAIFRIPLANMLGGTGMGYFSSAYGVFMTVYAVSVTGLPVAAAKLTAERSALEDEAGISKVRRTALLLCSLGGLAFTLLMLALAYPFCAFVGKSPRAVLSVAAIAPSVLFACITAVYRGCFEGRRNMYPTAVSQVIEAAVKLISGLALCYAVLNSPDSFFVSALSIVKRIFPFESIMAMTAGELVMPLAAAAAVFGVTVSSAAGTAVVVLWGLKGRKSAPAAKSSESTKAVASQLISVIIPVALGSLVTNLTSLIDLATIVGSLGKAVAAAPEYFSEYINSGVSPSDLPNFFFGSFTGLAVTVFNLIPSFTNMFGKGAVPAVAEGFAAKDKALVRQSAMNVIFTSAFIAVPSGIGISVLAPQILDLLFPSRSLETSVCVLPLRVLGAGVIFLSVSSVLFAVLQAAGKGSAPVKIMLWGVGVKLAGNLALVAVPKINVTGAAFSTSLCYLLIMLLSVSAASKCTEINVKEVYKLLFKLTFCGSLCGAAAFLTENLLSKAWDSAFTLLISVPVGALFYIISTHLTGVLTKSTLKLLIC